MSNLAEMHDRAMTLVDRYYLALSKIDYAKARRSLNDACELEAEAARAAPVSKQPTRSILFRSAASLAYLCARPALALDLVNEGLKHQPPPSIEQELEDLLENPPAPSPAFEDVFVAERARPGELVQRIRLLKRRGKQISAEAAGQLQAVWSRLFKRRFAELMPDMDISLDTLSASPGSYNIDMRVSGSDEVEAVLSNSRQILDSVRKHLAEEEPDPTMDHLRTDQDLSEIVLLLQKERMDLTIEFGVVGSTESDVFEFGRPSKRVGQSLARRTIRRVDSSLIPQADRIERVFRFVELLSKGDFPTAKSLEVDKRQVNYYHHACRVLGFVAQRGLTPVGSLLLGLSPENRLRATCAYFEATDIGASWVQWSPGGKTLLDVEAGTAKVFLREVAYNLTGETIGRRAQTLEAWRNSLRDHHYALRE